MIKKITVGLIDESISIIAKYKKKGIPGSALLNMALKEYDVRYSPIYLSGKVPLEGTINEPTKEIKKVGQFLNSIPTPAIASRPKHFMTTADKIWLEAYRMAESKGGTMSDEGWIEFEKIIPPQWYLDMKAAGEL